MYRSATCITFNVSLSSFFSLEILWPHKLFLQYFDLILNEAHDVFLSSPRLEELVSFIMTDKHQGEALIARGSENTLEVLDVTLLPPFTFPAM